jgi:hypothetical protein
MKGSHATAGPRTGSTPKSGLYMIIMKSAVRDLKKINNKITTFSEISGAGVNVSCVKKMFLAMIQNSYRRHKSSVCIFKL